MPDDIKQILEAGNLAPSGENTQPWKFHVSGNIIDVYNRPERDQSLYNWGQRASIMANGAAIENMAIAASRYGYDARAIYFPEGESSEHVATIILEKTGMVADPLYAAIKQRHTNRKSYKQSLTQEQKEGIIKSFTSSHVSFYFTDNESLKKKLGQAGSTNEVVMLGNRNLHQFFFSHINWNEAEDSQKKIGFFIDTLELAPQARLAFPVIKNWKVMNLLNKLGMNKSVGRQNGTNNALAGGFAVLTIPDMDKKSFIEAGRSFERLWLTITSLDLSLQPLTGVLFFMYQIMNGNTEVFTLKEVELIKEAYRDIRESFKVKEGEILTFMCRIGIGKPATARSSRFALEEVLE